MNSSLNRHTYHPLLSFASRLRGTSKSSTFRCLSTPIQPQPQPQLRSLPQKVSSPSPASQFATQYLVDSCGLSPEDAARASKHLARLKSPERSDSVLHFLRQAGVAEPHIKAAAIRDPSFLCYNVDKCLKPRMAELRELGFSPSQISLLVSLCPAAFRYTNMKEKVQFWIDIFGSVDGLLRALKLSYFLLTENLDTFVIPKISLLQDQCGLSVRQIAQLFYRAPKLITCPLELLAIKVKRAEELGIPRSSKMFIYALTVVGGVRLSTLDAKLLFFASLGFSEEQVAALIRKAPYLLTRSEEILCRTMEFLIKEGGCDKLDVVTTPALLMYSLEDRLIPRNLVRNLLKSKGLRVGNLKLMSFMNVNEAKFVEKFVLPYEDAIPGLYQAYRDACVQKPSAEKF